MFCIGCVEDTMVPTSEHHQIEDLIAAISYAEFRREFMQARVPTLMMTIDGRADREAAPMIYPTGTVLLTQAHWSSDLWLARCDEAGI